MHRLLKYSGEVTFSKTYHVNYFSLYRHLGSFGLGVQATTLLSRRAGSGHCHCDGDGINTGRYFSTTFLCLAKKTHYDTLNVNRTAATVEIRDAFLKLSKECHPDLNMKNDPEENHRRFVALNEAYTVLSKPTSRRDYDLTLQVEKHLRQYKNYPAYRSYGYQDSPHYHHRSHEDWDGMSTSSSQTKSKQNFQSGRRLYRILINYYSLTAIFTIGFVTFVLGYRDYINIGPVNPKRGGVQSKSKKDLSKHEFIMTSLFDGQTVLYYAVPDNENPESFKVHAFLKREVDGDPDDYVLEELNSE